MTEVSHADSAIKIISDEILEEFTVMNGIHEILTLPYNHSSVRELSTLAHNAQRLDALVAVYAAQLKMEMDSMIMNIRKGNVIKVSRFKHQYTVTQLEETIVAREDAHNALTLFVQSVKAGA